MIKVDNPSDFYVNPKFLLTPNFDIVYAMFMSIKRDIQ